MVMVLKKLSQPARIVLIFLRMSIPDLGGNYEVIHHTIFLQQLIDEGKIKLKEGGHLKGNNHLSR